MRAHDAVRDALPAALVDHPAELVEESQAVSVIDDDPAAARGLRDDMVERSRGFESRSAWHRV